MKLEATRYDLDGSKSSLGTRSRQRLETVNADLAHVVTEVSKWMNISVISGQRGMAEQNSLVEQGFSKLKFPTSKHNTVPYSAAVDIAPYHNGIDWEDIEGFEAMVRLVKVVASTVGLEITCGADWKSFKDYPHIELK